MSINSINSSNQLAVFKIQHGSQLFDIVVSEFFFKID